MTVLVLSLGAVVKQSDSCSFDLVVKFRSQRKRSKKLELEMSSWKAKTINLKMQDFLSRTSSMTTSTCRKVCSEQDSVRKIRLRDLIEMYPSKTFTLMSSLESSAIRSRICIKRQAATFLCLERRIKKVKEFSKYLEVMTLSRNARWS